MRKVPLKFSLLAGMILALNAAGIVWIRHGIVSAPDLKLRVLRALPERDVDEADRFSLVFDEKLVEEDVLFEPLAESPFVVEPEPEGHWQWAKPDRLDFVLARPLPAGRVYSILPAANFELQTGRSLAGKSEFTFTTRPLRVLSCRLESFDGSHVTFKIVFNQKVDPTEVLRHIRVTGRPSRSLGDPVALVTGPAGSVTLRVERRGAQRLRVELDKELAGHGGELPLGEPYVRMLHIAPAFTLLGAGVSTPSLGASVKVNLRLSSRLDRSQKLPKIEITPKVENVHVSRRYRSLVLEGPFASGGRYTARVVGNLLSSDGQVLGPRETVTFTVPDRNPALRFKHRRGILMPEGNLGLEVEMVNIPGIRVSAARVHAENIVAHVRGAAAAATSRKLVSRTFVLNLARNKPGSVAVNLGRLVERPLGVYQLQARTTTNGWTRDSAIVTVTDLGITAKRERGGFLVWATSLRTGKPVEGARVSALSYNNQRLAASATGPDGIARLRVQARHPDGPAWLILAELGRDMNYLKPDARRWVIEGVDQSGRAIPDTYDVMLYTERGVYRPGDAIHITGIVRDAKGAVPPSLPLAVRVTRPDGRLAAELAATTETSQGVFHARLTTRDDFQTGRYRFDAALPGSKKVLGSAHALVEAFVPVRIEVDADMAKERFFPEDDARLDVSARYLFGRAASDLPLAVEGEYSLVDFKSKRHPRFSFRPEALGKRVKLRLGKLKLDGEGASKVDFGHTRPGEPGLWRAILSATVTETGGRSVSANSSALVDTAGRHVGVRIDGDRYVRAGRPVRLEWVVVTGRDEPAEHGEVEVSLHRVSYDYAWQKVNGRRVWKCSEHLEQVFKRAPHAARTADGVGRTEFTCPTPGRYRLRALDRKTGGVAQLEFHASDPAWGSARAVMDRPERLEIVLDRKSYAPSSARRTARARAKALVRSPFPGTMLLTVETDRVIDRRIVQLTGTETEVDLDVDPTLRGGAFVTATVVRAIDPRKRSWRPHRAMGLARLVTDHSARKVSLAVSAPRKVRPGGKLSVTVTADRHPRRALAPAAGMRRPERPAYVHVWAVDEGILLASAYRTPDPHRHFLAQRRAGVATSDVFYDLLPDFERPGSIDRIGAGSSGKKGDYSAAVRRRRKPVATRRRRAAVVWRSSCPLGPDGRATFQMEMPDITGEMRIMAVAVDGDTYASAERKVTITAPLLVEASWPRFTSPGDRFSVPVKLFNTTDAPLSVSLDTALTGPVVVEGGHWRDAVTVDPRRAALVWLEAESVNLGPVTARVTARASSPLSQELSAKAVSDFPVRPIAPLHAETRSFRVAAGQRLKIGPPEGFLPGSARTTLSIGADPLVEVRPAVNKLIRYPYGCIEQTTSRLYAMLYAPQLLLLDSRPGAGTSLRAASHTDAAATSESARDAVHRAARSKRVADMVEAGIDRLWSMQTPSGGLGYWPGATKPHLWGTAYASFFLLKARQAGYEVDKRFVLSLMKYLESVLRSRGAGGLDNNTRALFCHVLAGGGRPQQGWMARLSEMRDSLDMAGRASLAAAWFNSGRKDRARAVLSEDTLEMHVVASTGGRITSKLRQEAVLLFVLLEIDPESPWVHTLAQRINAARKRRGRWGSTLENATALAALSRYQTLMHVRANYTGRATLPGGDELAFDDKAPAVREFKETGEPIEVASTGTGTIHVSVTTEGLFNRGKVPEYDRRLKVRRRWTDGDGKAVDPAKLKVGDLVNVETTLSAPGLRGSRLIHNIAIVDALPGGLEVENPRLATSARSGSTGGTRPDHVEFLDDRVVLFTSVGRRPRSFKYALRVIAEGDFALPPVQASCMYDAGAASVNGSGRVEVHRYEQGYPRGTNIAAGKTEADRPLVAQTEGPRGADLPPVRAALETVE